MGTDNQIVVADATNTAFDKLVYRKTDLAGALAAEDSPVNPWTIIPQPRSQQYFEIQKKTRALPAAAKRQEFIELYQKEQVIIVTGDTGSGKTTQIPQYIMYIDKPRGNRHQIVCTQPRRVAAREVARRVATELDVELGQQVGYSYRREENQGELTRLVYKTDGRLLVELKHNNLLAKYSCIIIDEAHERTESTDLLLGFLKPLLRRRSDLKLVIMSATMKTQVFQDYFDGAPIFEIEGRAFPVTILYPKVDGPKETLARIQEYMVAAVQTVLKIIEMGLDGDILVFMPGQEQIEAVVKSIKFEVHPNCLAVLPLYRSLHDSEQEKALRPDGQGRRKCIVSSNLAETSLTIEGIRHVIDCGLQKAMSYNPRMRLWSLRVEPISQASAKQRAGRAGRTAPGMCWRLYTEQSFETTLIKNPLPASLRGDMSRQILDILSVEKRADSMWTFDYIDKPSPEVMMRTWYDLQTLGCIGSNGLLTVTGSCVQKIPLEPRHALALVRALQANPSPVWEVAAIVSLLNEDDLFVRPTATAEWSDINREEFASSRGDHFVMLNIWSAFEHQRHVICKDFKQEECLAHMKQWCRIHSLQPERMLEAARTFDDLICHIDSEENMYAEQAPSHIWGTQRWAEVISKVLLSANFTQIAVKDPRTQRGYLTLEENQSVHVHPSSALAFGNNYNVIFYDVLRDSGSKPYLCYATPVDSKWLFEPNTAVGAHMLKLIRNPPRRSDTWVSLEQLRIAYGKFQRRRN